MSAPPQSQTTMVAAILAASLALVVGVFSLFSGETGSTTTTGSEVLPPSKSPRNMRVFVPSVEGLPPSVEDLAAAAAQKISESVAIEEVVLADGTVIAPGELIPSVVANLLAATTAVHGPNSDLKSRLMERAGKLAIHDDDPWKSLTQVAVSHHRMGNTEAGRFWFERAIRSAADPDSPLESSLAFRDVTKGLLSVGEIDRALEVIRRIPVQRYRDFARADVVGRIALRKDFDRALLLSRSIEDAGARVLALRNIAQAQARYDSLARSLETVAMISSGRSRDDALMRVALARASVGDRSGASQAVERIGSDRTKDLALVRLADTCGRGAGSPEAYLSLLHDPLLRDESLLQLVEKQVAQLKFTAAQRVAAQIHSRSDRAVAMELLVSLQVKRGNLRGALKRAQSIEVESSHDRALQTIALQQTTSAGPRAARFTADLISSPKARDMAYRKIAERAASLGDNRQIRPTIGEIENPAERATAFASVARLQARRGLMTPARIMISEAEHEVQNIPERKKQWKAMSMLATAHLETGDQSTAMNVAAGIDDARLRDQTYQLLSRKFAGLSEIALAEESAHAIQKETTREKALDEVARVVAGRTRATEALGRIKMFDNRRQQVKFLLEVARRI